MWQARAKAVKGCARDDTETDGNFAIRCLPFPSFAIGGGASGTAGSGSGKEWAHRPRPRLAPAPQTPQSVRRAPLSGQCFPNRAFLRPWQFKPHHFSDPGPSHHTCVRPRPVKPHLLHTTALQTTPFSDHGPSNQTFVKPGPFLFQSMALQSTSFFRPLLRG